MMNLRIPLLIAHSFGNIIAQPEGDGARGWLTGCIFGGVRFRFTGTEGGRLAFAD